MEQVQYYLDIFKANPEWTLVFVFLIAFGEALLIIGLFVPSTVALVGAGALVGTGHLGFWPVFIATAAGAIGGDQVSYWVGRYYGDRLKSFWPLNRYPQLLARGEDYVRQHGGKSIAIGRFVPGVKAVVPGIVGMFRMNQTFFVIVNFTSGLVWTAAHIVPGILLGQGLSLAGELSGRLAIVLVVLLVLLAVAGWLIRLASAGMSPYVDGVLRRISGKLKSFQSRPMQRLAKVMSPDHPRSYLTLLLLLSWLVGLFVLLDIVLGLVFSNAVSNVDVSADNLFRELRNAPADELMVGLSMLGDGLVIFALGIGVVVWLFMRKAWRAGIAAAAFLLAAKLLELALKYFIARPRPVAALSDSFLATSSFPSGHAVMSTVAFGIVAMLASQSMGRWSKAVIAAMCGLIVIAIGFSRIYLGVHWVSDVLGGFLLGTILVSGFGVLIEAIPARRIRPAYFSVFMFTVLALTMAVHYSRNFDSSLVSYSAPEKTRVVVLADFIQHARNSPPDRRVEFVGAPGEQFVGQWIGSVDGLKQVFKSHGWVEKPKWRWPDSLGYLDVRGNLDELPPRPMLHKGLKATFTAVMTLPGKPNSRLVFRVYKSDIVVQTEGALEPVHQLSVLEESLAGKPRFYALPKFAPPLAKDRADVLVMIVSDPSVAADPIELQGQATPVFRLKQR